MPSIRVNRLFPAVVAALALLFAVLEPPASRSLVFPAVFGFWLVHIGVGMLLAVWATEWLSRRRRIGNWRPWLRLLVGGFFGSLLFAPFALAVDTVLPVPVSAEISDGPLDRWEAGGGALALLAEWLQLGPSYLASWRLVNSMPLAAAPNVAETSVPTRAMPLPPPTARVPASEPTITPTPQPVPSDAAPPPQDSRVVVDPEAPLDPPAAKGTASASSEFLALLPPAIGTDLISIEADLHYLQVRTTRGRAMLLSSISTAERAMGAEGLRVHRSYWVAIRHVARVARTARGTFLMLSDGSRVPVSRRRIAEVQARLGRDFVVEAP